MSLLIVGLLLFFATHSVRIFADPWRSRMLERFGEPSWKLTYALLSLLGLVLIALGYDATRGTMPLWSPPGWTRPAAVVLMLPVFVLLIAAYLPGTRIREATGHPLLLGVKLWAFAHLLANGTLPDLLLFGSFLVWAVADYAVSRRRDRAAEIRYPAGPPARDGIALIAGLAVWALFTFWLHRVLFGVSPLG